MGKGLLALGYEMVGGKDRKASKTPHKIPKAVAPDENNAGGFLVLLV